MKYEDYKKLRTEQKIYLPRDVTPENLLKAEYGINDVPKDERYTAIFFDDDEEKAFNKLVATIDRFTINGKFLDEDGHVIERIGTAFNENDHFTEYYGIGDIDDIETRFKVHARYKKACGIDLAEAKANGYKIPDSADRSKIGPMVEDYEREEGEELSPQRYYDEHPLEEETSSRPDFSNWSFHIPRDDRTPEERRRDRLMDPINGAAECFHFSYVPRDDNGNGIDDESDPYWCR